MKTTAIALTVLVTLTLSARAEDAHAKITDVHLCCKGCVNGLQKAVDEVPGAKADIDAENGTVTLSGSDAATVQKAADSMVKAGYFGKTEDHVKLNADTGASD